MPRAQRRHSTADREVLRVRGVLYRRAGIGSPLPKELAQEQRRPGRA